MKKADLEMIIRSNIYQLYKQQRADLQDLLRQYKGDMQLHGISAAEFDQLHEQALSKFIYNR